MNRYANWFRWAVIIGVVANLAFAVPGVFSPNRVLRLAQTSESLDPKWTAFAAWLLILLSMLYIPGALDPYRYRQIAVLSVLSRLGGVIFFFVIKAGDFTPLFGLLDLFFFLLEAPLLFLVLRAEQPSDRASALR